MVIGLLTVMLFASCNSVGLPLSTEMPEVPKAMGSSISSGPLAMMVGPV